MNGEKRGHNGMTGLDVRVLEISEFVPLQWRGPIYNVSLIEVNALDFAQYGRL